MRHVETKSITDILAAQRAVENIHAAPIEARDRLTAAQSAIERIAEQPPTPADLERALVQFHGEFARVRAAAEKGDPAAVARLDRMMTFFNDELAPHLKLKPERVVKGKRTPDRSRLETDI